MNDKNYPLKKIQRVKLPVTRAKDNRKSNCDYRSALLVVCPHCASPAWSFILTESHRRVTCTTCGFSKILLRTGCRYYGNSSFSLFLAMPCLGDTLWVYNPQQLAELKEWIQAYLRERLYLGMVKSELFFSSAKMVKVS